MKIDFKYEGKPGLKIIQQIADGKIVWVIGYNGVGKSLAAKLLEIISGNHMFDSRAEYESLKAALSDVQISIAFDDGHNLLAKLNPREQWAFDELTQAIRPESIGEFYERDQPITVTQFNDIFEARIIRGNESLSTQIIALITYSLEYFDNLLAHMTELEIKVKDFVTLMRHELQLNELETYERLSSNLLEEQKKALGDISDETEKH